MTVKVWRQHSGDFLSLSVLQGRNWSISPCRIQYLQYDGRQAPVIMKVKVWRKNNSWFLSFIVIQGFSAGAAVTVFWHFQLLVNFKHLILLAYHLRNWILMKFLFFGSSIRLLEAEIYTRSGWLKRSSSSSEVFRVCKSISLAHIVGCADVRRRTVQTFGRQPEITWVMSKTRTPIRLARLASKTLKVPL